MASTNRMPTLMLAMAQPASTGMTAHAEIASTADTSGASRNTPLLAPDGIIGSLNTIYIDVGNGPAGVDRNDGPCRNRQHRRHQRGQQEHALVGARRDNRFLEHE